MVFRSKKSRTMLAGAIAAASLLIAGCGGGGNESAPDASQPTPRLAWDQANWDQAEWQ